MIRWGNRARHTQGGTHLHGQRVWRGEEVEMCGMEVGGDDMWVCMEVEGGGCGCVGVYGGVDLVSYVAYMYTLAMHPSLAVQIT